MTAYRVFVNGRDSGIVETNLAYYVPYWRERARVLNARVELRPEPEVVWLPEAWR